jgi:hypothetical protein
MSQFDTEILPISTLSQMVEAYETAVSEIQQAYALFGSASKRLDQAFGGGKYGSLSCYPNNFCNAEKDILLNLKKSAWRVIIGRMQIEKVMSIRDLEDFQRRLDDPQKMPEITLDNLIDITQGLKENAGEYAKKLVLEVYDILMPGTRSYDPYQTNKKNARRALGKKVILQGVINHWLGHLSVSPYARDRIGAVDKVFFALDGKGVPGGYNTPLLDAIDTSGREKGGVGETEYFKFYAYQNGNLHLEFRRLDLVTRLNQIAGIKTRIAD